MLADYGQIIIIIIFYQNILQLSFGLIPDKIFTHL